MTKQERIDLINNALDLIEQAQGMVDEAVDGTRIESNYTSYARYGFDTLLGNGNRYDASLYTLLDEIEEEDDEQNGDEDVTIFPVDENDDKNIKLF